jgi:hypothetical protein
MKTTEPNQALFNVGQKICRRANKPKYLQSSAKKNADTTSKAQSLDASVSPHSVL